jgi:hypothetical protein
MKMIFILLFSISALATSFAQTGSHQIKKRNNQYVTNAEYKKIDCHRDNIYTFSAKESDAQIAKINKDYNFKITAIKSNKRISRHNKKVLIQKAQLEKSQQIQEVNSKFNSKFNTAYNHIKIYDDRRN